MEPIQDDLDELELSDEDGAVTESDVTQSEDKAKPRKTVINSESEELSDSVSEVDDHVGSNFIA